MRFKSNKLLYVLRVFDENGNEFQDSKRELGTKESFAVSFKKDVAGNIIESLIETFNRRWNISTVVS